MVPIQVDSTLTSFFAMTYRDLISQGIAPGPFTQNALLAFFIPLILGIFVDYPILLQISKWYISLELPKLYRTKSRDPEQRPKIVEDVKKQYDFVIVGERQKLQAGSR